MSLKIAMLDDDEMHLSLIEAEIRLHNAMHKEKAFLDVYKSYDEFLENFNHDMALVDIFLKDSVDGFEVAKNLMKKHKIPVVMVSQLIENDEPLESFMPKNKLDVKELFNRFNILKKSPTKNILQIFTREDYYHAPAFAG